MNNTENGDNSTLDSLMEGFQLVSFDWRYLYVNRSFVEQSKMNTKKDLLGFTMMEKFPGIEKTEWFKDVQECMTLRIPKIIVMEFTFPDNSKGHFELRVEPVPKGIFILSIDITEKKKSEEKLKESIERFKYATLASNEIIYDWDIINNKVWWNENYYEFTGLKNANKLLDLDSWTKFIHPDDHDRILNNITDFLTGKVNYWTDDYRLIAKNKDIHNFSNRGFIVRDKEGKPFKLIGAMTDITIWKQNIQHLEEILFSISHKVRQPVAHILGIANLLENDLITNEELNKIVGYMKESTLNLNKFTLELTDIVSKAKSETENKNWA